MRTGTGSPTSISSRTNAAGVSLTYRCAHLSPHAASARALSVSVCLAHRRWTQTARNPCCSSRSCARWSGCLTRICTIGLWPGPRLPWPAACHWVATDSPAFPVPPSRASAARPSARLCWEGLFILTVLIAMLRWLSGARDLITDNVPAQHPRPLLRGYRVHTLLCRGSGLPLFYLLSAANFHHAPFARPLLEWALRLYQIRPRLIAWIHATFHAVAVIPWNPYRQKNRL